MNHRKVTSVAAALASVAFIAGCTDNKPEGEDLTAQALAAAEAAGFRPPDSGDGGTLHIYTWSDYIAPDVLSSFEVALKVKVVIDTFDSNEAMYAKLKAGGTGYDIIMPSSYQIATMAREGMIDKLDHSKIPNVKKNFDPSFSAQVLDPSFTYSAPYAVTYTGLAYRKDKMPEGAEVASWAIIGNPAMKGRVSLLDDIREVIGAGLMYLGYSVNSTSAAEINAAVEQVLKWRVNVRKFDAESYKTEVASGATWIGHGYSTDVTQVIVGDEEAGAPARDDVGFALPKEGFAIAFDEMVVAKSAKRKDLAYAFINYIYDGDVAKVNMEYICGPNPVKPGIDQLDPEYRDLIVLNPEQLKRGQLIKSFDGQQAVMDLYNKAWDRIKATEAR
ncbi:MAG: spermidine/putrescine ABC transporter substrate-binding protein [Kiritimatiellae bacterium]|nr:spermidine/putrescine ABC transporter substrate-binding protein [Kiritimatiellia bacterium]